MKKEDRKKVVFVCAKLSTLAAQSFNKILKEIVFEEGFEVYLGQEALLLDVDMSPIEILEKNEKAVDNCDILLFSLDGMGEGVAMEMERAYIKGKTIIGFRTPNDYLGRLGKMVEGFWQRTPEKYRATSLEELRKILRSLKNELS